jgi:hypothetical protein
MVLALSDVDFAALIVLLRETTPAARFASSSRVQVVI